MTKLLIALVIGLMAGYAWSYQANQPSVELANTDNAINTAIESGHDFAGVPTNELHTMRVWEDGSYNIEYKDGTSERGCLTGGLCND